MKCSRSLFVVGKEQRAGISVFIIWVLSKQNLTSQEAIAKGWAAESYKKGG